MAFSEHCPKCGAALPPSAPKGLCPACLLLGGLAAGGEAGLDETKAVSASGEVSAWRGAAGHAARFFGDYELLEEIARGGMGVVYKARQGSVNRIVALKMIVAGRLAAPADVERFRVETEAAARLEHPHIVPIYEVGQCDGLHFFTMKFVEGGSLAKRLGSSRRKEAQISSSSDARKSEPPHVGCYAPKATAQIVATIARAVHYAHQCGILHRDLKPGNILLDAAGQPYLTDFGLAKFVVPPSGAAGADEPAKAGTANPLTASLAVIGTPSYMAPEQAAGQSKHLTTAADIYSLGAIFYELLAGRPPFTGSNELEILRRVIEDEPVPPSRVVRSRWDDGTSCGHRPSAIDQDLETICLKCLNKEPSHRYRSAEELAQELERWLAGETILARPASTAERAWRWCRRKPALASLAAAAVTLAVTGVVGVTWQWRQAVAAQWAEADERHKAVQAEAEAQAVLKFFQEKVLAATRPQGQGSGRGAEVTLRAAVDAAESEIAHAFAARPLVEASIRYVLGQTYYYLADFPKAAQQSQRSLALRKLHLPAPHSATAQSMNGLARAYIKLDRVDDAVPLFEQALEILRARSNLKDRDAVALMGNLAMAYERTGRRRRAAALLEKALDLSRTFGTNTTETLALMNNLAVAYGNAGRLPEALTLFQQTLKQTEAKHGRDNPDTVGLMDAVARACQNLGRLDEAVQHYEEALNWRRVQLGPTHRDTLASLRGLAETQLAARRFAAAESRWREWLDVQRESLAKDDLTRAHGLGQFGEALLEQGKPADAEPILRECLDIYQKKQPERTATGNAQSLLGAALLAQRRYAEAELPLLQAYEALKRRETQSPSRARAKPLKDAGGRIVQLYDAWGKPDQVDAWRQKLSNAGNSPPHSNP